MIRIRGLFAVGGLLFALAMVLAVACGGGSGGKSKTTTPATTRAGTPRATITGTPGATGQTTSTGQNGGGTPASTASSARTPLVITPVPTTFGERAAGDANDALLGLRSDLTSLRRREHDLRAKVTVNGEPTPTLVAPLSQDWFNACCRREMQDIVSSLRDLDRGAAELSTTYSNAGHTQGKAAADQIITQLAALRHALDAVSAAPTRGDAVVALDDADAAMTGLRDAIQTALDCCIFMYPRPTATSRRR